jgi:hypothetical protein
MTKSVILISIRPLDLVEFGRACESSGRVDCQSDHRLVVEGDWGWFALDVDQSLRNDFDDTELAKVRQLIREPIFGELSYSDNRVVDLSIKLLPLADDVLVDNDHGVVLPVGEIRRRIKSGREWQVASI